MRLLPFATENRTYIRFLTRWLLSPVVACLCLAATLLLTGCAMSHTQWKKTVHNDTQEVDQVSQQIDQPSPPVYPSVSQTAAPVTALKLAEAPEDVSYVELSLNDVLRQGMQSSTVLRDIGGIVLRSPDNLKTSFSTQLQESDPRFGMEAALSEFDAQLSASASFNNNDRIFNNAFFSGGASNFRQDLNDYEVELSKRTATGSLLSLRGITNYDSNNAPANTFGSYWDSWLEGEMRQPLLQGGGLEFNRIAGPGGRPGVYNGVLIAKANSDINYAEFTRSLRDFVSNVENAYWDLYFAYRELNARKKALERALVVWNEAKTRKDSGNYGTAPTGEEALARQQYYQLKAAVDEALSGRLIQGTQTQNGSSGGTLQLTGGVLTAERRLRLVLGMPAADGQLLRPQETPTMARIDFDWEACMNEAIQQRSELQKRHVAVKKRELELLAAKNFLNPRLDAVGRYRLRGFGHDLVGSGLQSGNAPASALGNLATGDTQEWMLGVELSMPVGFRRAHAAVKNAELALARERTIQKEQQREIISNLNGAIADAARAYQALDNNLNQYLAASEYVKQLETREGAGQKDDNRMPDAHRRLYQAEIEYFRSRAEYAVALKNVHFEKGSLLRYRDLRIQGAPAMNSDLSTMDTSRLVDTEVLSTSESAPPAVPAEYDFEAAHDAEQEETAASTTAAPDEFNLENIRISQENEHDTPTMQGVTEYIFEATQDAQEKATDGVTVQWAVAEDSATLWPPVDETVAAESPAVLNSPAATESTEATKDAFRDSPVTEEEQKSANTTGAGNGRALLLRTFFSAASKGSNGTKSVFRLPELLTISTDRRSNTWKKRINKVLFPKPIFKLSKPKRL